MLRIFNLEEIQLYMDKIPGLVDLLDKKDPFFSDQIKKWIKGLEDILSNNHLYISGQIGALRGLLISAEQGVISNEIQFVGQPTKKKVLNATAGYVINQAGIIVSEYLQSNRNRINEAERHAQQLITFALSKGLISEFKGEKANTQLLKNIWQVLRTDPELLQGVINIESLVGPYDALIILDRTLSFNEFFLN
ncbi:MAG: hypothetical protein V2I31_13570 [Mariniphaga sp.]|jgi:hypothetical protein|nr:hypothetical protein [Mariniphaga sp.]